MQLTLNWLKQHIPEFELADLNSFKHKLDTRLSEVESVRWRGTNLEKLVIGEITEVNPHPSSEKLTVCTVNVGGKTTQQIVCGAPNVRVGLYSVVCLPGGQVEDGKGGILEITEREVAGVTSAGMLCALDELGLWPDHNKIIEVDRSLAPGSDVTNMFRDVEIEIENKALPHRPDAFSHLGIAREISAIFKTRLGTELEPNWQPMAPDADQELSLNVQNKFWEGCLRYSAIALNNVKVGPSPLWLQIALAYAGTKPINNVVDITNYVMHDIGQPLHAFDYDKLASGQIVVRKAAKGEKITTIDHQERILPENATVIADLEKPIAVAGIMGGADTEISEQTTQVVLESANFEMYSIRRTSRQLGLRSEAVTRFEKGVDPKLTVPALRKAAQMLIDICDAEISSELVDEYPNPQPEKTINFDLNSVRKSLGVDIDKNRILNILESLGFEIEGAEHIPATALSRPDLSTPVTVMVPSWRRDINASYDLVEEVGRIYGYEFVPISIPKRDLQTPKYNHPLHITHAVKDALAAAGLQEVYTYSMVGAELYAALGLTTDNLHPIKEAISPELGFVRNEILPSLLEKVVVNSGKYQNFGLFEISRVALLEKDKSGIPHQPFKLAGVRFGDADADVATVYRQLKSSLEHLSATVLQGRLQVLPAKDKKLASYWHPQMTGLVVLDADEIGYIGVLHPKVQANLKLNYPLAAFNLNFDTILGFAPEKRELKQPSSYPAVDRDLSIWMAPKAYFNDIKQAVENLKLDLLQSVAVVDEFMQGEPNQASSKRSLTMRFTFQASNHTITSEETNNLMQQIQAVVEKLGHQVR
jgi:phenylalanyl-tRNA synthetase beta chain